MQHTLRLNSRRTAACALLALGAAACEGVPTSPPGAPTLRFALDVGTSPYQRCGAEVPVTVTVTDGGGNPAPGVLVNFHAAEGGGKIFSGTSITGPSGTAKDYWTIGSAPNALNVMEVRSVDPETGAKAVYDADTVTSLTRIAFSSVRDGNWEIYLSNPDGSDPVRVTSDPGADVQPAWSPDGRKIAFASNRDGDYEIYTMNGDGTGLLRLTENADDDQEPAWSPDGTRIVFRSTRQGDSDIWGIYSDGSSNGIARQYTSLHGAESQPTWGTLDGFSVLAFVFKPYPAGDKEIYLLNLGPQFGWIYRRITESPGDDDTPQFSSRSSQLVFTSTRDGNREVYSMWPLGGEYPSSPSYRDLRRLTSHSADDRNPTWSPDGGSIAFVSTRNGTADVYRMRADGTDPRRVSTNPAHDDTPTWSGCTPY